MTTAKTNRNTPDRMDLPFVGLATFAGQPACPDWDKLDGADVAILGIPIDTASSYRVGTRFGPRAIREVSMFHGFGPEGVFDFEDEVTYLTEGEVRIVDAGDSDVIYADTKRSLANAEQAVRALLDRTMPYILGPTSFRCGSSGPRARSLPSHIFPTANASMSRSTSTASIPRSRREPQRSATAALLIMKPRTCCAKSRSGSRWWARISSKFLRPMIRPASPHCSPHGPASISSVRSSTDAPGGAPDIARFAGCDGVRRSAQPHGAYTFAAWGRSAGRPCFCFTSATSLSIFLNAAIAAVSSAVNGDCGWKCASSTISASPMRPICLP